MNAPAHLLEWDTAFFRRRIARVADGASCGDADEWARANGVECLYLLANAENAKRIREAEAAAFHLADIRMTLERSLQEDSERESFILRHATPADVTVLKELAQSQYGFTRFFRDPGFDLERSATLYALWIEKIVVKTLKDEEAVALVLESPDGIAGYIAAEMEGDTGRIALAGVVPAHRGRGVGTALVRSTLRWIQSREGRTASVVTQGANIPALRLYTSNGFYPVRTEMWYHKWYAAT